MSDNARRYRAVRQALRQLSPTEPTGNQARHLNTLAGLISGIVGSRRTNLPAIAAKVPDGTKRESRVKRFARWVDNERVESTVYFLPFAAALLACLAQWPLVLVMDGSVVGRGCVTLLVSVIYKRRALPLAWIVVQGRKGHFPEDAHVAGLRQIHPLIPPETLVVFVGDGEFDGTPLQATLEGWGWWYACHTAENTILTIAGVEFAIKDVPVQPGECFGISHLAFTRQAYGPVLVVWWWQAGCKEPLYLVSNMETALQACTWYAKRFHIETFFSDQKSRGFHLHKSHLADPARLSRLMIAACLAYIWIVFLGAWAIQQDWVKTIHRTERCDLSLFQLGLNLLEHLLNEELPIPVAFHALEAHCYVCV
jgi:hypothetical protein